MTFDWKYFLSLAAILIQQTEEELTGQIGEAPIQEARLRSAISRAYYAAFCKACNYLQAENPATPIPTTGVHSYVYRQFQESGNRNRQEIAWTLRNLKDDRERADYDDKPITNLILNARKDAEWAREIISALEILPHRPRRHIR
jgi:uncharacterized protein (UPF0332 family)